MRKPPRGDVDLSGKMVEPRRWLWDSNAQVVYNELYVRAPLQPGSVDGKVSMSIPTRGPVSEIDEPTAIRCMNAFVPEVAKVLIESDQEIEPGYPKGGGDTEWGSQIDRIAENGQGVKLRVDALKAKQN
jgi:hypothetical protein